MKPYRCGAGTTTDKSPLSILSDTHHCHGCGSARISQPYTLDTCKHQYCTRCVVDLINESLSLLNKAPRCSNPGCLQLLSTKDLHFLFMTCNARILPKYRRLCNEDTLCYLSEHHLLCGYIRRIQHTHLFIPDSIAALIYDYFRLIYHLASDCLDCHGIGHQYKDCKRCNGLGCTTECKQCNSTGISKYSHECLKCGGSGRYRRDYPCHKCSVTGVYGNDPCRACAGSGRQTHDQNGQQMVGICISCGGCGRTPRACFRCHGSGIYKFDGTCRNCDGNGKLEKQTNCGKCAGTGEHRVVCKSCKGDGRFPKHCKMCNGNQQCMVLDINQLRRKQSLCVKCNKYYPNDQVFHWDCYHAYCGQCVASYIPRELQQQRHPECVVRGCESKLSVKALRMMNVLQKRYVSTSDLRRLVRFQCTVCTEWKLERERFEWSDCQHVYCKSCAADVVDEALSSRNEVPMCMHAVNDGQKRVLQCSSPMKIVSLTAFEDLRLEKYTKGTGRYLKQIACHYVNCMQCDDGSGSEIVDCDTCDGFGRMETSLDARSLIYKCRGFGFKASACQDCGGCGKNVRLCCKCSGSGNVVCVDFEAMVREQSKCIKCGQFMLHIFKWSTCNHSYCEECFSLRIQAEVTSGNIPKCVSSDCRHQEYETHFSAKEESKHASVIDTVHKLNVLMYRQGRFQCNVCHEWHSKKDVFVFSRCGRTLL